jgi:hypothetical protein
MRKLALGLFLLLATLAAVAVEPLLYCPYHPGMVCQPDGQHRTVGTDTYAHYTCVCGDQFWHLVK